MAQKDTINDAVTIAGDGNGALLAGRYRVVRQLGQGGMGSVWLAEDTQLDGKKFAIKMLPSILVSNKRAYNQLKAEALVAMKLTHPNIVTLRAFEENNGNPFLVMDYIDGQTLDDYLAEKGKLSEEETVKLLKPVAAALDYAHGEGVVHRDVKPANVMIRTDGHPFILDFGIAREIQETLTRVTGKLSSGTLLYMSPEQLNGESPKKEQDIYSFAAMVYECLSGNPPFYRGQIEYQIINAQPPPLLGVTRLSGSATSPETGEVADGRRGMTIAPSVMAGLAKKPEGRPSACSAVLGGGDFSRAERVEMVGRGGSGGVWKAIGIIALLAALGVGGWWYYAQQQKAERREQAWIVTKQNAAAERRARAEAEIKTKEEGVRRKKAEAERLTVKKAEAERKEKESAEGLAKAETERRDREETERRKKEEVEQKAKEEVAWIAAERVEANAACRELEGETSVKPSPSNYDASLAKSSRYSDVTKEYVVKPGDSLGKIAYSHGITILRLKEMNGMKDNNLRIGQKLKVPAEAAIAAGFVPSVSNSDAKRFNDDIKSHIGLKHGDVKTLTLLGGAEMKMIYVAPGSFMMGSPETEDGRFNNETQHQVTLTNGYWLGKYEVTQQQWLSMMGGNPSSFKGDNHPVENVSWEDCQKFIQKVNDSLNCGARLPTEAEWEYACRAGSAGSYGGSGVLSDMGWYDRNSGNSTHPIGQKRANAWGFHDMHGNVREWCKDDLRPWFGHRVLRGGSWRDVAQECRSALRAGNYCGNVRNYFGFRLCCSAEQMRADAQPVTLVPGRDASRHKPLSRTAIMNLLVSGEKHSASNRLAMNEEQRCISLISRRFYECWTDFNWTGSLRPVLLSVRFGAAGNILGYKIVQSSGDHKVDQSVLAAAKRADHISGLSAEFLKKYPEITIAMTPTQQ